MKWECAGKQVPNYQCLAASLAGTTGLTNVTGPCAQKEGAATRTAWGMVAGRNGFNCV